MARKRTELARLVPKAVEITIDKDSDPVLVATTAEGNRILNYFVAAQIRDFLQRAMKRYNDEGDKPSPKDLKDLAEAGRAVAEFSAKLYLGEEASMVEKPVEQVKDDEDLNFDNLTKKDEDSDAQGDPQPAGQ